MLHTKILGHRSIDARKEKFSKVFTIYGHSGNLGHVTLFITKNFSFPFSYKHSYKIWFQMTKEFLRKKKQQILILKLE